MQGILHGMAFRDALSPIHWADQAPGLEVSPEAVFCPAWSNCQSGLERKVGLGLLPDSGSPRPSGLSTLGGCWVHAIYLAANLHHCALLSDIGDPLVQSSPGQAWPSSSLPLEIALVHGLLPLSWAIPQALELVMPRSPRSPRTVGYRKRLGLGKAEGQDSEPCFPFRKSKAWEVVWTPTLPEGTCSPKCPCAFSILWEKLPHPSLSGVEFE